MRFLLSRRWLFFAVAVGLAAWGATLLGEWQFHRLDDRRAENSLVTHNLKASPVPIDEVMSTTRPPRADDEWQRVTVTGEYDDAHTVILKYQTRDGRSGVDVVTPLVTGSGAAVLVDRGWLSTANKGNHRPETPAPPPGEVEVTGYVRADATGGSTAVHDLATRAVSSRTLAAVLPHPLYVGFLDLEAEPEAGTELVPVELPDHTSQGPHFFYGLQWWFFGALAIFGFFYLMYDEWRRAREGTRPARRRPRSERPQHPAVDRKHDTADE